MYRFQVNGTQHEVQEDQLRAYLNGKKRYTPMLLVNAERCSVVSVSQV